MDLPPLSPCDALVAIMVAVCASGGAMTTPGMVAIERIIDHAPVFATYDADRIRAVSQTVMTLFEEEDGLDALFGLARAALPEHLFDTAYAFACDVAIADGHSGGEVESAMLAEMRAELGLDRLHATAIELGADVRHRTL